MRSPAGHRPARNSSIGTWSKTWCIACFAVALVGCDAVLIRDFLDTEDVGAPTPGGEITVSNVQFNVFTLSWPRADDDWTPREDLEYRVFGSQFNPIETLAEAEVNSEFSTGWNRDRRSLAPNEFDGAVDGVPYYVNVFVRDGEGNTASYGQAIIDTVPRFDVLVNGIGEQPRVYRNLSSFNDTMFFAVDEFVTIENYGLAGPLAIGDISQNGLADIVQGQLGGPVLSYVNTGFWDGNGLIRLQELSGGAAEFENVVDVIALGQFTGDQAPDLFVINGGSDDGYITASAFSQFSQTPVVQTDPNWNPGLLADTTSFAAADLDIDGFDDIVLGLDGSTAVFRNDGSGDFISTATFGTEYVWETIVAPITVGDDDLDILAVNDTTIRLDIGAGDATTFVEHTGATAIVDIPHAGVVADFDGDGDLDLAVGRDNIEEIVIYLNAGITANPGIGWWVLSDQTLDLPGVSNATDLAAADFDADGDMDLVMISNPDAVLAVWSNEGGTPDSTVNFELAFGFPVSLSPMIPTEVEVTPIVP